MKNRNIKEIKDLPNTSGFCFDGIGSQGEIIRCQVSLSDQGTYTILDMDENYVGDKIKNWVQV